MAGFYINTNKVDEVSENIKTLSSKCESIKSSVSGYDTSNEGGFDFSGAVSAIENNLEGAQIKFTNTAALLDAVVKVHGGIQDSVGNPDTSSSNSSSRGCGSSGCGSRGCGSRGCASKGCGGCGAAGGSGDTGSVVTPSPYTKGEFVNYYQYNYKQSYGYGTTIASAGCGPTSMSMVLTYLLGETHDPVEIANWSLKGGYHIKGNGTSWSFFPACAKAYGVECKQMSVTRENIINNLKAGKIIIMNVGPGHFTSGGHYIVLRGITADGKIIVADPNSEKRSKQVWDIDVFLKEGKGMWAFDGGKIKEKTGETKPKATVEKGPVPETTPSTEPTTVPSTTPETTPTTTPEGEKKQSLLDYLKEMNNKGSNTDTNEQPEVITDDSGKAIEENVDTSKTTLETTDLEGLI